MPGIQEILVLVAIAVAIVFIPRMTRRQRDVPTRRPAPPLTGKIRLAIVLSVLWPALLAAFLKPWQKDAEAFLYIGCGPVVLGWLVYWVAVGFRKHRPS
jgi:hypothetical protein